MKKYMPRSTNLSPDRAQIFGEFLEMEFKEENITPEGIVSKASFKKSPVHRFFEWDNEKAGHSYRLWQARSYVRAVTVLDEDNEPIEAFHHVKVSPGVSAYVSLEDAKSTGYLWKQVVENALKEVKAWSKRYEKYSELSPIHTAIKKTERKVKNEKGN